MDPAHACYKTTSFHLSKSSDSMTTQSSATCSYCIPASIMLAGIEIPPLILVQQQGNLHAHIYDLNSTSLWFY